MGTLWRRHVCAVLLAALVLPGAAGAAALKKASFVPLWSPQAQFAGYYVALDKGFYRRHGIDLTILAGGPDVCATDYLRSGRADFALLWLTTALQQRAKGVPLVNVAQIVQRSSMLLVTKKSSGIKAPAEMNGKKVGLWGGDFAIPPRAFFEKYHLKVKEVPQSYTVNLFLRGGVDVASAMWYNEYHTILDSGVDPDELRVFFLQDYGINYPEDGLYTLEATCRRDPQLVSGFVQASLEGWAYAFAHPDEAIDLVMRQMREAGVPANRAQQQWMLARMRDLILPCGGNGPIGWLQPADYATVTRELQRDRIVRSAPGYREFVWRSDASH